MKFFGTLVALGGIALISQGLYWIGVASVVLGILLVVFNSKMSET